MRKIVNLPFVMALFAALLLGAGCASRKDSPEDAQKQAFEDVRAEIYAAIPNSQRATKVVGVVSAVERNFLETQKNIEARRARVLKLYADYDATRAEIEQEYDQILMDVKSNREMVTDVHRQLVDLMTAEEWAKVKKAESEALAAAVRNLQSN